MAKNYTSPLLQKYQKQYDKDPTSRVFAPLAETYRKLGMLNRAIEILRDGIKHNPDYVMGYVGLAACYIEKEQWEQAYTALRPFVTKYRDNLRLQNIFAQTCLMLGHREEALETYKYLLFMNPKDKEAAQNVRDLEEEIERERTPYQEGAKKGNETSESDEGLFEIGELESTSNESFYTEEIEGWQTVDFSESSEGENSSEDEIIEWDIQHTPEATNTSKLTEDESLEVKDQKDFDSDDGNSPEITHTLVDMYISRGHIDKAKEILEKILELNPNNQETKDKLSEINELIGETDSDNPQQDEKVIPLYDKAPDEGHQDLLSDFDQQAERGVQEKRQRKKQKLEVFLAKLKSKSQKHRVQTR